MKKLILITAIVAIGGPLLAFLLHVIGLRFDPLPIARELARIIGSSFTLVGIIAVIVAAVTSGDKNKIYQGAFCTLLGVSIFAYSLLAFVAAVALVAWMDFRNRSLT